MRTLLSAAVFAAAIGFGYADDPKKEDKAAETIKDKLTAIQKSIRAEMGAWSKDYQKAGEAEKEKLMERRKSIINVHGEKALAAAKELPKDPDAFDALMMAVNYGADKVQTEASDLLMANFADDEKMLRAIPAFAHSENAEMILNKLGEKSKKKEIQGFAKFTAMDSQIEKLDSAEPGKALPLKEVAVKFDAIGKAFDAIAKEFGDVEVPMGRGKMKLSKAIEGKKTVLETLVVGRTAPDVECEMLDGKKSKLSDFRGKVVVLDIWATWCGPCVAMIPHEREMVEKRKDKKFVLISVSADKEKKTLTDFLEKEEMPWTHWWDGGAQTVTEKFKVEFFPTIYVLDAKGVIRFKHCRGKAMDAAVDTLLKEMETGSQ